MKWGSGRVGVAGSVDHAVAAIEGSTSLGEVAAVPGAETTACSSKIGGEAGGFVAVCAGPGGLHATTRITVALRRRNGVWFTEPYGPREIEIRPHGLSHPVASRVVVSMSMRVIRAIGAVVLAVTLGSAGIVATAGPAHACSCVDLVLEDYGEDVAVAFTGRQIDRVVFDDIIDNGVVLLFEVATVYKGEVGSRVEVRTHAQSSACGTDFDMAGIAGVAAFMWRDELHVSQCGSAVSPAELEAVFGEGSPPDETIAVATTSAGGGDGLARVAVIGAGLVVAMLGVAGVSMIVSAPKDRRPTS